MRETDPRAALLKRALRDPSSVFDRPREVVDDPRFERRQKLEILARWEADARLLEVAEEENMGGADEEMPSWLPQVREAIAQLEDDSTQIRSPTKLG